MKGQHVLEPVVNAALEKEVRGASDRAIGASPHTSALQHLNTDGLAWRLLVILLYNAIFAALLYFRPFPPEVMQVVANVGQFAGQLLAIPLCFADLIVLRYRRRSVSSVSQPSYSPTPWWLCLGVLCFTVGQIVWTWYESVLHQPMPFPSLADVGFLAAFPCIVIAILTLPGRRLSLALRTRFVLDGLMVMTALFTFSWYFTLGPTMMGGEGTLLQKAVGLAYPLLDVVVVGCLLLMASQLMGTPAWLTARMLILFVGITIVADTAFLLQNLAGTYETGLLSDVGWPLGHMLVVLSARTIYLAERRRKPSQPITQASLFQAGSLPKSGRYLWRSLMPYTVVPVVAVLLIYVVLTHGDSRLELGVYIGSGALVVLVLLRQLFAILENARLYNALGSAYQALEANNRRLEALATIDPLTDLPNHRAMVAALDAELERGQRWNHAFAVLFIDLDHFKALNDGYGHNLGDATLREFGRVMQTTLRGVDLVGRWGGEEFVAVLPQIDREQAIVVAERVRETVAAHSFTASALHLTCSIGVALHPHDGADRNALVAAADSAMYAAKRSGRDRVCVAGANSLRTS